MKELSHILHVDTGHNLSGLDQDFVQRTLKMRMKLSGVEIVTDYLDLLSKNKTECHRLSEALLVNHSLFFRGRVNFALLADYILPAIFQSALKKQRTTRIWSAGCAAGQEAWSLAMLCDSIKRDLGFSNQTMVFGTDIAHKALDQARKAIYEPEAVGQVTLRFLQEYFDICQSTMAIRKEMLPNVSFSYCDLANDLHKYPPDSIFGNFDLISCCNVLIYYNDNAQKKILQKLSDAMLPGGFLMVGENERSIAIKCKSFRAVGLYGGLFKKH